MTATAQPKPSSAFFMQAGLSFGVALVAVSAGIAYLPVDSWMRAFLAIGVLYVVTSSFTLAKCVRDHQEAAAVTTRVDQARLDKIFAEHDPFATP
jgi:hypothetical protein